MKTFLTAFSICLAVAIFSAAFTLHIHRSKVESVTSSVSRFNTSPSTNQPTPDAALKGILDKLVESREAEAYRAIQRAEAAISAANAPHGLPYALTLDTSGTNQYVFEVKGNVIVFSAATNTTGLKLVSTNIWMRVQ